MMTDPLLSFVPVGAAPVSLVGAAGATVQIGAIIDLLGQGVGTAPQNIIGNRSLYGVDPGPGRMKPEIEVVIGTALATGNAATAEFALQYAPDGGAAANYQPGAWEAGNTTGAKAVAEYAASVVVRLDLPPAPPSTLTPRYMRLVLLVPSGTNLSAGTVTFAGLVPARDDYANRNMAANYAVA